MFFALHGQGAGVDVFAFYLAEQLGKTLGELDDMPHSEYVQWSSYYKVKQQREELARMAADGG